ALQLGDRAGLAKAGEKAAEHDGLLGCPTGLFGSMRIIWAFGGIRRNAHSAWHAWPAFMHLALLRRAMSLWRHRRTSPQET
ncbi:MAG: hypothetical protein AAFU72_05860, partial [Pseudomonadota bacterium]